MSEFKGTRGEWKYEIKKGRITVQIPIREKVNQELVLGKILDDDCDITSCCRTEEHANAKLISCAPELLEMVDELLKELAFHGYTHSTAIVKAQQLIKKATEL